MVRSLMDMVTGVCFKFQTDDGAGLALQLAVSETAIWRKTVPQLSEVS